MNRYQLYAPDGKAHAAPIEAKDEAHFWSRLAVFGYFGSGEAARTYWEGCGYDLHTLDPIPKPKLKRIHVNQHLIRSNLKNSENRPVITVKEHGRGTRRGHSVEISGPSTIVYRPKKPLSCGARVWIETTADVTLIGEEKPDA